jgi:hypothetical protein
MSSDKKIELESNAFHYNEPVLKIFRIHPNGCRIVKAEKTLQGQANQSALTWCGAYEYANSYGWWVFPGFDVDIVCHENPTENSFRGRWGGNFTFNINSYDDSDYHIMKNFESKIKNQYDLKYAGPQHYAIDEPEKNCISLWTGCVFQMPKDWSLMIKSPTNLGLIYDQSSSACIQEGILELDWMRYDIWTNFKFHEYEKPLRLRKNQSWPIAQLIPIHRASYETKWITEEKIMDPNDQDCVNMYERYSEYKHKKWVLQGQKDPFTFKKLRKSESRQCPMHNIFEDQD